MLRTRCRLSYLADNLFSAHHFFLKMSSSKMSSSSDASSSAISHVLFDMDGLLLDTEELYSQSYQIVNDRHGAGKYTFEFKVKLMGTRPLNCAKMMIEQYKLPISPEEFVEATTKEQEKLFPGVRWMPGMLKLVHHLYKNSVPIAVATSSGDKAFELKTSQHSRMFQMFNHVVKGSEVEHGKPAPDIFLECARRFPDGAKINPELCLGFEDSPNGVLAVKAAGMQAVMIPDKRMPKDLTRKADYVLKSGHDFRPERFGLPAYGYRPVTHVIFDMDGLLLNTTKAYSEVTRKILERHGKTPCPEFGLSVRGMRFVDFAQKAIDFYGLPYTVEEYDQEYKKLIVPLFRDTTEFLEGVETFLAHLHKHNIPMAVATSSNATGVEHKMSRHRAVFDRFSHMVTGSDPELKNGKPAPDIFQMAADRFDDKPDHANCLVFEDAPNGVVAAGAAGMQSVMILEGVNKMDPKKTVQATQLLSSMTEFRPQDFGLPAYDEQ